MYNKAGFKRIFRAEVYAKILQLRFSIPICMFVAANSSYLFPRIAKYILNNITSPTRSELNKEQCLVQHATIEDLRIALSTLERLPADFHLCQRLSPTEFEDTFTSAVKAGLAFKVETGEATGFMLLSKNPMFLGGKKASDKYCATRLRVTIDMTPKDMNPADHVKLISTIRAKLPKCEFLIIPSIENDGAAPILRQLGFGPVETYTGMFLNLSRASDISSSDLSKHVWLMW